MKKIKYYIFRWFFVWVPILIFASWIYLMLNVYPVLLPYIGLDSYSPDFMAGSIVGLFFSVSVYLIWKFVDMVELYFRKLKEGKIEKGFLFKYDADVYCDFCKEKKICPAYRTGVAYPCDHFK